MTNTQTDWKKRFDKKFSVFKYEQDGEQHEGFRTSKVPNTKDVKAFISNERKLLLEEVRTAFDKAITHGILPDPNPHGVTVKVQNHNRVVKEMKSIFLSALTKLQEKES